MPRLAVIYGRSHIMSRDLAYRNVIVTAKYIYGKRSLPRRTAPYHRVKSMGDCGVADALKYIGEIENM
jgi:hypothetical protein